MDNVTPAIRRGVRLTKEERRARYEGMVAMQTLGKSLEEIGAEYGLTRERVRQILATGPGRGQGRPRTPVAEQRRRLVTRIDGWRKRGNERKVAELEAELAELDALVP